MIELLILFSLTKRELTMYGIQKAISENFGAYTKPSFGALNPALKRLEKDGCLKSRRALSEGGKQSCFYTITNEGLAELKKLIIEDISENPLQFFSNARIKLSCTTFLTQEEASRIFLQIKSKAMAHKYTAENILNDEYTQLSFYQRVVLDNTVCEYQNLITLIENLEKNNASNS